MIISNIKKADMDEIRIFLKDCAPYVVPHHKYIYWMMEHYYASTCFVAKEDNHIIGFLSALPSMDKNCAFLWQIAVSKNQQNRGIAKRLLEAFTTEARKLGLSSIQMSINENNIPSHKLFQKYAESLGSVLELIDIYEDDEQGENLYNIKI